MRRVARGQGESLYEGAGGKKEGASIRYAAVERNELDGLGDGSCSHSLSGN
jgi:hypothetical protein